MLQRDYFCLYVISSIYIPCFYKMCPKCVLTTGKSKLERPTDYLSVGHRFGSCMADPIVPSYQIVRLFSSNFRL